MNSGMARGSLARGSVRAVRLEPPRVDVLIVTMNARELVLSCLEHMRRQTMAHTVFLADNGQNADGTTDAVHAQFPEVQLVETGGNVGFGKAMNRMAAAGNGDVIVLANDDMDVEPEFLERLVAPFEDPRVGMAAALTLQPGEGELVDGFGIEVDRTLVAFNRLRHRLPTDEPGRLLGPSGGAAAYRRSAWEAAEGLDERFFIYGEDVDLALRLRLEGWEASAASQARAVHLGGATSGIDSPFQRWNAGFARGFLLHRYGVLRSRNALRALTVEALIVLWGLLRFRTSVPLRARIAGWRAASTSPTLRIPAGAIDERISFSETLRRLRSER
jgi:N-acetylglucosaminyl-diphospho-decaprenol L-rhamnosyltransferase